MSAPKISQTTTDATLLGRRDAFHVPGVLVKAVPAFRVWPGADVRFADPERTIVEAAGGESVEAIVDPFLRNPISEDTLFWVFLVPELSSNLTHHFEINRKPEPYNPDTDDCAGCYESRAFGDDDDEGDDCARCYS